MKDHTLRVIKIYRSTYIAYKEFCLRNHLAFSRAIARVFYIAPLYEFTTPTILHLSRLIISPGQTYQSLLLDEGLLGRAKRRAKQLHVPVIQYMAGVLTLDMLINDKPKRRKKEANKETLASLTAKVFALEQKVKILEDDAFKATLFMLKDLDSKDLWKFSQATLLAIAEELDISIDPQWNKTTLVEVLGYKLSKRFEGFKHG